MNVRIKYDLTFSAAVFYDDRFRINHYSLGLWMCTNHPDPAMHNIALERIKHFVYNELDSTIFININQEEQCAKYLSAGLNITTLPTDPVDQVVGVMLWYKLNAIMEQHLVIFETTLSSILGDNVTYLHNEDEHPENLDVSDWWSTADLVHCDQTVLQNEQTLALPRASVWRDLELNWPEYQTDSETGNVLVFADFKNNETK